MSGICKGDRRECIYPCRYVFVKLNGAIDEYRFTCVGVVRWQKASVARYGMYPDKNREEWNNVLLLLCGAEGW